MTQQVTYVVERDSGVPYFLARLRWPDVSESINPTNPTWTEDPGLRDMLYDSSGEIISEGDAKRLAQSWGATL